jgi:cation transport regulator ChaB
MIDVDDIKSALDDAATALREQADLLEEARGLIDDDTVQNEYRDAFVEAMEEDVDAVESSGPGEDETQAEHDAWVAGYRAAIAFLNENY